MRDSIVVTIVCMSDTIVWLDGNDGIGDKVGLNGDEIGLNGDRIIERLGALRADGDDIIETDFCFREDPGDSVRLCDAKCRKCTYILVAVDSRGNLSQVKELRSEE